MRSTHFYGSGSSRKTPTSPHRPWEEWVSIYGRRTKQYSKVRVAGSQPEIDSGKIAPCHPILQISWELGAGCKCLVAFWCQVEFGMAQRDILVAVSATSWCPGSGAIPSVFGMTFRIVSWLLPSIPLVSRKPRAADPPHRFPKKATSLAVRVFDLSQPCPAFGADPTGCWLTSKMGAHPLQVACP